MLDTSKDILFYVSALSIIALTAFMCWLLYYFIAIIKDAYDITKGIKKKIDLIDDILKTLKDKINSTASYIGLAVNGLEKIVDYVQKKKSTGKSKKKS